MLSLRDAHISGAIHPKQQKRAKLQTLNVNEANGLFTFTDPDSDSDPDSDLITVVGSYD